MLMEIVAVAMVLASVIMPMSDAFVYTAGIFALAGGIELGLRKFGNGMIKLAYLDIGDDPKDTKKPD